MSGDLSASVAPRGQAFVLASMTNPHLAPPSPVGGVVGHNIDRRIMDKKSITKREVKVRSRIRRAATLHTGPES